MTGQLRKLASALVIAALLSAVVAALLIWPGSEPSAPAASDQQATDAPSGPGVGGGPEWIAPSRVTEGDWEPPGFRNLPTEEKPLVAQHVGEVINGIRIVDFGEKIAGPCPGQQQESDLPPPFEATYLPPNTFETAKPGVLVCPDGRMESAHRLFQIGGGGAMAVYGISFAAIDPVAYGWGAATALTINDWPSVALAPAQNNGVEVGGGVVVMDTPAGILEVTGTTMPLDELIKIAQGLKCEEC